MTWIWKDSPDSHRTTLRPDILLVSESTKNIIIMELTVPWEDCFEEAHERKRTKYEHLAGR